MKTRTVKYLLVEQSTIIVSKYLIRAFELVIRSLSNAAINAKKEGS